MVIDTLQKVRPAESNTSAYAGDYQDMSALKTLADSHNIALLLVHHLRKQGAVDPFQQISGSNGLMGAADTILLLQRQRMSNTTKLVVTGRDMDSRTLHLQSEGCVWQLLEEETQEEQTEKTVLPYLWQIADFLQTQHFWQGTATELLTAAGIQDIQPNQFTRKLVEHYYTVFAPRNIQYESRRTASMRQMRFVCDDCDGHDDDSATPSADTGIPEGSSSLSSSS